MVDRYPSGNWYPGHNLDIYVLSFQGSLRRQDGGLGVDTISVDQTRGVAGVIVPGDYVNILLIPDALYCAPDTSTLPND